jgi:hypothetical protein
VRECTWIWSTLVICNGPILTQTPSPDTLKLFPVITTYVVINKGNIYS